MRHLDLRSFAKGGRALFSLSLILLGLLGCTKPKLVQSFPPYLQPISTTVERLNKAQFYFHREQERIAPRKAAFSPYTSSLNKLPGVSVGLALSGGGIRSAAFQLGLMSGLHVKGILSGIDYISAVSGGSWAAGAYKASPISDSLFFQSLDAAVMLEQSKLCSDALRRFSQSALDPQYQHCNNSGAKILLSSYRESLKNLQRSALFADPLDKDVGYAFREAWRAMIQENFLLGVDHDVPLNQLEDRGFAASRPYLIINATHSEDWAGDGRRNFPFQFTADAIGTVADCGNTGYCPRQWARGLDTRYKGIFLDLQSGQYLSGLSLSHAMAISGAVAPASFLGIALGFMEWNLPFPLPPAAVDVEEVPYRKEYVLADGGHSDNFGALPLMERNVDIMIISDAAFDSEERFEDFLVLKSHAKALLGKDVYLRKTGEGLYDLGWITGDPMEVETEDKLVRLRKDALYDPDSRMRFNGQYYTVDAYDPPDPNMNVQLGNRHYSDICGPLAGECRNKRDQEFAVHRWLHHGDGYRQKQNGSPVIEGYFNRQPCDALPLPERYPEMGKLLYVKPPKDLNDFLNYLREKGNWHIYNYLTLNKGSFPCDKTFAVSYHNELIQAYYLLGKFIGEGSLASAIMKTLTPWPQLHPPEITLNPGESALVEVEARSPWNDTGIKVMDKDEYRFTTDEEAAWCDSWHDTGPTGFDMWLPDWLKRVPEAKWFELVGAVREPPAPEQSEEAEGKEDFLFPALKPSVVMARRGRLFLFANDAAGFYANNSGKILVKVERSK